MRRAALPSSGLYPLAVLSPRASSRTASPRPCTAPASPRCTSPRWCSATRELPHRNATRSFAEGVAWLAQIGLFVMLGLLLSPGRITLGTVGLAVAAGLILTLVARPLSVLVSSVVSPMPLERAGVPLLGRAARRGARSSSPRSRWPRSVDGSERLFDIVFVMVVLYTLLTGPTLPLVARWLKVARRSEPRGLEVEVAPLERIAADLLQVSISPRSRMHGVEVGELRLPKGASVSMVIRDGESLIPERRTVLRHGDDLLVVTPRKLREQTEQRLRRVSEGGRLAQWLGDEKRRTCEATRRRCRSGDRRAADLGVLLRDDELATLGQPREAVADDDDHRRARSPCDVRPGAGAEPAARPARPPGCRVGRPDLGPGRPRACSGALPLSPSRNPSSTRSSIVRPASPSRVPALKTLTTTWSG